MIGRCQGYQPIISRARYCLSKGQRKRSSSETRMRSRLTALNGQMIILMSNFTVPL